MLKDFCMQTLVQLIAVNVRRAGAANLDVIQEGDMDNIQEYMLLKGVESVSINGRKDQDEHNKAIALFKEGKKDVLIATDIAAKGLYFPDIQHVINFDMPCEIENYMYSGSAEQVNGDHEDGTSQGCSFCGG